MNGAVPLLPLHLRCVGRNIFGLSLFWDVMQLMFLVVEMKNQLDATEWFIALIICSTCFGYFYAHHHELETICVLLPPMVCDALVAGCWMSGAEQQAMRSG